MTEPGDRTARVATTADSAEVVSILVSAFHDDPAWSWAFPAPATRTQQHQRLWELFVDGALRYPWVWLTPGNTATAVWIPPEGTEFPDELAAAIEPTLAELFGEESSRVIRAFEMFERAHPQGTPHFYLTLLGTHAEHRGHGYGLGLLAENLRQVDEAAMPAYLEASNPANVPLYMRHGFEVLDSFTLPLGGPEVFTMWRDASPGSASPPA